jgi:hypothetical protein
MARSLAVRILRALGRRLSEPFMAGLLFLTIIGSTSVAGFYINAHGRALGQALVDAREPDNLGSIHRLQAAKQTDPLFRRVLEQLLTSKARRAYHARAGIYWFAWYNSAIHIAAVAGVIAAIMLALVAPGGWTNARLTTRVTFLSAAGIAAFASVYPKVYRHDENALLNARLYVEYANLENHILSAVARCKTGTACTARLDSLITTVDKALDANNSLIIGFDSSQLPDFRKTLALPE